MFILRFSLIRFPQGFHLNSELSLESFSAQIWFGRLTYLYDLHKSEMTDLCQLKVKAFSA